MAAKAVLIRDGEATARGEVAIRVAAASRVAVPSMAVAFKAGAIMLRVAGAIMLREDGRWATPVAAMAMVLLTVVTTPTLEVLVSVEAEILPKENLVRWQATRGGGFQQHARDNGADVPARTGIDANLLHQTVQAVVAAVTAATKVPDAQVAVRSEAMAGGTGQHAGTSVAAPNAIPHQTLIQEVQEPQLAGAKGKENESQGPQKKKKEDKQGCFRCKQPGHYIDDCPTPFCDLCESVHHATSACHLLQAPKPTTIMHGYANEALMFFELPCGAFKAKVDNPKLAKVTVDGDAMTILELIDQLKKIVPSDKFNWEVFHYKENIYRVKLPSKQEVQRLKNFGTYICNDREACLSFDIWSSLEEPLYTLPEVWVRVSGLPNDIRSDYLSLWGVGTLFGKTLDVDMAYTRNNKVLRTKIGCLDRNLIPADSDVFIRRGFFKLHFEVEVTNGSQEVDMTEVNNGNDGNDDTQHGEHNNGGGAMLWIWILKEMMRKLLQIMADKEVPWRIMGYKGCN
ncbi:hypothetical protein ACQ4PT_026861 [Festuca glaucescens]